jgi:SAM-dependent methyltransferase
MNESLQAHYERKYSGEAQGHALRALRPVARPLDRFEAAVTFIPRHFKGGSILELGAGDGAVAKALLGMDLGLQSYELGDLSLARVQGVRENLADPRVQVRQLDAERAAEGATERYDAIVMIALIEHLIDPLGAMQSLRRLLKPGGFVYIDTPNLAKYTRRAQLLLGRFPSTASRDEGLQTYAGQPVDLYDEGHLHYFTFRSLTRMLTERCGFARVQKLPYACGRLWLGARLESALARAWPEAFSELAVLAYAGDQAS